MTNFALVQACEKDFDQLLQLRLKTMTEELEKAGLFLSLDQHKARVREHYSSSFKIFDDQQMVGMLKYCELPATINIMQLQIFPAWQGQGIGRDVLTQLMQNRQGKSMQLTVLKENPAKHLYERLGFTITGEDEYEYFMQNIIN